MHRTHNTDTNLLDMMSRKILADYSNREFRVLKKGVARLDIVNFWDHCCHSFHLLLSTVWLKWSFLLLLSPPSMNTVRLFRTRQKKKSFTFCYEIIPVMRCSLRSAFRKLVLTFFFLSLCLLLSLHWLFASGGGKNKLTSSSSKKIALKLLHLCFWPIQYLLR